MMYSAMLDNDDDNLELVQDRGRHPKTWDEFVGQDAVKRQLRRAARSAQRRGEILGEAAPMNHMMIVSPEPGSGKTSLALLAAAEAGAKRKVVKGEITEGRAIDLIFELGDGGVLIWDEMHQGFKNKKNYEWLYQYAQQAVFMDGDQVIPAPRVTIIGATTDLGDVPTPIAERFTLLPLAKYTEAEAASIAFSTWAAMAEPLGLPMPDETTCLAVAKAASNRSRYMQRIWEKVIDAVMCEDMVLEPDEAGECSIDLTEALADAHITADGLSESMQRYMLYLRTNDARPRGRDAAARGAGVSGYELASVERLLVEKGYVEDTGNGRKLTTKGRLRAFELLKEAA